MTLTLKKNRFSKWNLIFHSKKKTDSKMATVQKREKSRQNDLFDSSENHFKVKAKFLVGKFFS